MPLIEPYAYRLALTLQTLRECAEAALKANDLDAIRHALRSVSDARIVALDLLSEGEAETRKQALSRVENAA